MSTFQFSIKKKKRLDVFYESHHAKQQSQRLVVDPLHHSNQAGSLRMKHTKHHSVWSGAWLAFTDQHHSMSMEKLELFSISVSNDKVENILLYNHSMNGWRSTKQILGFTEFYLNKVANLKTLKRLTLPMIARAAKAAKDPNMAARVRCTIWKWKTCGTLGHAQR